MTIHKLTGSGQRINKKNLGVWEPGQVRRMILDTYFLIFVLIKNVFFPRPHNLNSFKIIILQVRMQISISQWPSLCCIPYIILFYFVHLTITIAEEATMNLVLG